MTFDGGYYHQIYHNGYNFTGDIQEKQPAAFLPLGAASLAVADWLVPGNNAFVEAMLFGAVMLFFTLVGIFRGIAWKHDRWLDTVQMQRALGPGNSEVPANQTLQSL